MSETQTETRPFQAEVNQVLHLVIHSLYSHKEVFLRELISNASDALDRLRFRAVTEPDLLAEDPTLEIRIRANRDAGTLTIEDTGVGMTRQELSDHLGTIARSGSRAFLEALAQGKKDMTLIGQFGVGFYSAFLVADRVVVISRAAGADGAYAWSSDAAGGTFTLAPAERHQRGTAVELHLKADQRRFLDEHELKELVRRYSDFVGHPIKLGAETTNRASALWQRPKNEISDDDYNEFYKHLTRDFGAPLARTHFRAEGTNEFVGLLFIPARMPLDVEWGLPRRGVRLFVRRVFVMDNCEELLPEWLRFVRGVVDADNLPLNVSREVLQDSAVVRAIRKQLVKKTLDLLDELAKNRADDYATFWKSFGSILKAGLHLEPEHKERLAKLVRYEGSKGGLTSLADYRARMAEDQPAIYYALGDAGKVAGAPHLEALQRRGWEVLYMTDPVDEWAVEALESFDGKPLISVMRADLALAGDGEGDPQARDAQAAELAPLFARMRAVLQDQVQEVRLSSRLTDSPLCLVVPEGGHHAFVERLLRNHGANVPAQKRILEVNGAHPLVRSLHQLVGRDPASPRVQEWIEMLYDQALLGEGSTLTDPHRFARRLTSLLAEVALNEVERK